MKRCITAYFLATLKFADAIELKNDPNDLYSAAACVLVSLVVVDIGGHIRCSRLFRHAFGCLIDVL